MLADQPELTIHQELNLWHFSSWCGYFGKYMCVIPDAATCAVDHPSCSSKLKRWHNPTTRGTVYKLHPQTDGTTCCTTGLWSSHSDIGVDTKINPLSLSVVQGQCTVHLESWKNNRLTFTIVYVVESYKVQCGSQGQPTDFLFGPESMHCLPGNKFMLIHVNINT